MFSILILVFLLVLYSKPVLSQWALSQGSGGQFITYSGLISGLFRHPQGLIDQGCPDYTLGPHNRTYLYIGQVPYDANPFFFELYHFASAYSGGGFISYTNDSIFNLDFTSIGHPCFKNGRRCGSIEFSPWYYVVAEMLDLGMGTGQRKAAVERVQVGSAMGYKVSGDQMSFISNGTIKNLVDVARPYNLTAPWPCMYEERYIWYAFALTRKPP
jgi:hypothetical protein